MYGKDTSPMDPSWVYICMKFDPPKNESHLHSPKLTSRPWKKAKGPKRKLIFQPLISGANTL